MPILKRITMGLFCLLPAAFLISMAAMETLSWLTFLVFLTHLVMDIRADGIRAVAARLKTGLEVPLWGFFLTLVISAYWNISDANLRLDIIGDGRWILLLYAYSYLLKRYFTEGAEKYLLVASILVVLVGAYSLVQFVWGIEPTRDRTILKQWGEYYRATGFFSLPLTFAATMGMAGFVLLGTVVEKFRVRVRWPMWPRILAVVFAFLGVLVSLTRGAWLAAAVSTVATSTLLKKRYAVAAIFALSLGVGFLYQTNPMVKERITSVFDDKNRSNNLRFLVWQTNWEIIKEHPMLGVGFGQNKEYYYEIYERLGAGGEKFKSHAHNNFLQIWAGLGVFGLLFFIWFCWGFLNRAAQLYKMASPEQVFVKGLALGLVAAQIHFHVGGFTECNFTDGEVNHLLIFLWGLLLALESQTFTKTNPQSSKAQL